MRLSEYIRSHAPGEGTEAALRIALYCGVSLGDATDWLNGNALPPVRLLHHLIRCLCVDVDEFLSLYTAALTRQVKRLVALEGKQGVAPAPGSAEGGNPGHGSDALAAAAAVAQQLSPPAREAPPSTLPVAPHPPLRLEVPEQSTDDTMPWEL